MDKPLPFAAVRLSRDEPGGQPWNNSAESDALGQADRLAGFGQLASDLARQMESPLASISNHARASIELLRDEVLTARQRAELSQHLSEILRKSQHGSRITNNLLQYAEPNANTSETKDVMQVLRNVIELLTPMAQARNVGLEHGLGSPLPPVSIGPDKLEQLLFNLIQNGIDACLDGDIVRILAQAEDDRIRLVIEDTGVGIPRDHLERIFDPFYTTKPRQQGTGLGLSSCHRIVVDAGGSIEINSAPGCGTIMTVWLPAIGRSSDVQFEEPAGFEMIRRRRTASNWQHTLLGSFRKSTFIPIALLCASTSLVTSTGCSSSTSGKSEATSPSVPDTSVVATTAHPVAPDVDRTELQVGLPSTGARLYGNYCAACHGENGDGNGQAARFLYPKPRNFRDGQYRLISTLNHVPTDDDLMRVIVNGMPGSAMLPVAAQLNEADRKSIVAHVRELTRKGLEARFRKQAEQDGEEVDLDNLKEFVDARINPDSVLETPRDLPAMSKESVARGLVQYSKVCVACHGATGKGDGTQVQRDEFGTPIRPRDLTRGIFKGGRSSEQLYARIFLGIPGSPMPSSSTMKPEEVGDLINYVQSLSDVAATARSKHTRAKLNARTVHGELPEDIPAAVWDASGAAEIVVSPLWWRDDAASEVRVRALHDSTSLAIQLSWSDGSRNDQLGRVLDFPDMAAVELYKGASEPFLGMGAADGVVDVWLWNAAAQADRKIYSDVDTAHPNMIVDMYPFEKAAEGSRTHATDRQAREFLTALAAGNPRSDPAHPPVASNLEAKGFGSTTMRPRISQVVRASGHHANGRWTVVLRRPLKVASGAGLNIAAGDSVSIAFALWDGAVHDRNGQKTVSIWHDLKIE